MNNTMTRRSLLAVPAVFTVSGIDCLMQIQQVTQDEIKLPLYRIDRTSILNQNKTIMSPDLALLPSSSGTYMDCSPYHEFFQTKYTAMTQITIDPPSRSESLLGLSTPYPRYASQIIRRVIQNENMADSALIMLTHGDALLVALEYAASYPKSVYSIVALDPSYECQNTETSQEIATSPPDALKKVGLIIRSSFSSPDEDPVIDVLEKTLNTLRNSHHTTVVIPHGGLSLADNVSEKIAALEQNPLAYITFSR